MINDLKIKNKMKKIFKKSCYVNVSKKIRSLTLSRSDVNTLWSVVNKKLMETCKTLGSKIKND